MKTKPLIAMSAPVTITAAEQSEGEAKGPRKFVANFYNGGPLEIDEWDLPVVVDLAGLNYGNVLVANLDHDKTKRVGNFEVANDGKSLVASGTASAATAARDEVINSAADGYQWQASLEVRPRKVEEVKAGKIVVANGQEFKGPIYVTRQGTLKGFAFVSHGADDDTTVSIAAKAASHKELKMKAEVAAWVKQVLPSVDIESLGDDEIANLEADFEGRQAPKPKKAGKLSDVIEAKQAETDRQEAIIEIAGNACDKRPYDIQAIKELADTAIDGKWTVEKFRLELLEASLPPAHTVFLTKRDDRLSGKVVEAAICVAGGLKDVEKKFDDQTLQTAHDKFKHGIGLKQLLVMAAQANGYNGAAGYNVDLEVQRAAFGLNGPRSMVQGAAFSTFSLPTTLTASSNLFLREGFFSVDQTPMRIAAIRSVRNFQEITTVSLTGGFQFEKLTPDGEIPHASPGELTYGNKADTYGIMFAVTRHDIINDDLGALTAVPRRIGRGGMLQLNHIFWTEFLDNGSFFTSGNANVSTVTGTVSATGLAEAEAIFMAQTDPDGNPLGAMPKIWLVPTPTLSAARTLMASELTTGGSANVPAANIWRGRFQVESSPYMSNSAYTGYNSAASYLLADPNDIPVIEIVALNGKVEPTVETADTDFNTLGVQMRGYSDVGVRLQEYRGGVRLDGTAA